MIRILLVDDSLTYLEYCRYELEEEGYKILTAVDGQEALGVIESQHPDIVVLDISMPLLDGVSLLQQVRRLHPIQVVILHSAHREFAHDFETWSANAFVEKSVDLGVLKEAIRLQVSLLQPEVA